MAVQSIKYNATAYINGVKEKLEVDANGYYKCILGAFNLSNYHGQHYPLLPSVKALFEVGGVVRRRIDSGLCKGEYKHPDVSGLTMEQAIRRIAVLDELLISHHIKSLELVESKDEFGNPIILVVGWVLPTGPYGPTLKDQLANREENVAFSVRCLFNLANVNGKPARVVTDIFTYDHVHEPGISTATKYASIGLEELGDDIYFTEIDLNAAIATSSSPVFAMENSQETLLMVKTNLGWNKVATMTLRATNW